MLLDSGSFLCGHLVYDKAFIFQWVINTSTERKATNQQNRFDALELMGPNVQTRNFERVNCVLSTQVWTFYFQDLTVGTAH